MSRKFTILLLVACAVMFALAQADLARASYYAQNDATAGHARANGGHITKSTATKAGTSPSAKRGGGSGRRK